MPLVDMPFKRVAVDLIDEIHPPSEAGHRYILTLVDYATRYPEAVPLKTISTEAVAEALVDMYSRLGVPEEVLSDLGTQFVSECMQEVARLLNVKQLTTTPYHPMCNGLVEKFNGTLKMMLKRLCAEQPKQWHRYINALLFAYREVPQESTGFSPFELLYGRTVRGPMHILKELWTKEVETPEVKTSYQYVFELRERLEETLKVAQEELRKSQGRYKHYYDKKARNRRFKAGDLVLILLPTDTNKPLIQWKGPYKVEEVIGVNDYKVNVKGKSKVYHANLLKEYFRSDDQDMKKMTKTGQGHLAGGMTILDVACAAIIEPSETSQEDTVEDEELLELRSCQSMEAVSDIEYGKQLSGSQKQELTQLVHEFQKIFTDMPGSTTLIKHHIHLTSEDPIRMKPYAVPYSVHDTLKKKIQSMLDMGIIRESTSAYASPVVIVQKKDGFNRICIDYRKLNRITVLDPEPMTLAADIFQKISKDKYFTKIDSTKGYWQVPVAEEDVYKTAFVKQDGTYEFRKMLFGMMNTGAMLVRDPWKLLSGMYYVGSYIDDILVHTESWEMHLEVLWELFKRMQDDYLTTRPSKCVMGTTSVEFIGHWI